jgi:hypothetical protein
MKFIALLLNCAVLERKANRGKEASNRICLQNKCKWEIIFPNNTYQSYGTMNDAEPQRVGNEDGKEGGEETRLEETDGQ